VETVHAAFLLPIFLSGSWLIIIIIAARMGEERKVYRVLVGKREGKRPLGKPRHRGEDGIKMDLRKIGLGSVEWIQLAQDRGRRWTLVNMVMNLKVLAQ
jgi:hypothetical protein